MNWVRQMFIGVPAWRCSMCGKKIPDRSMSYLRDNIVSPCCRAGAKFGSRSKVRAASKTT